VILAATGHRPDKLGGYDSATDDKLRGLAALFFRQLHQAPDAVISGMALGWDMAWAEAAIAADIPVIAAVPFDGQESRWPLASQDRHGRILLRCREVVTVSRGGYSAENMQRRNRWMVDRADWLVALWDGSPSGTGNCVRYAQAAGKPIYNLWQWWQR
jgi:uncharacterized phage-like protein YoqJ